MPLALECPISDLPGGASLSSRFAALEALLHAAEQQDNLREMPSKDVLASRILVVDDEPVNAKVASRYLRDAGYRNCVTTNNSQAAIDLIHHEHPDLILLDLMMPGIDGLHILKTVRQDPDLLPIPVVVLTATDDRSTRAAALDLGATEFLTKPVDPTDLLPRIRNVLTVKAYQDHLASYARELEKIVQQRTAELEASRLEVIYCLGRAAEYRDNETGKHVIRVGRYVGVIARAMGLDPRAVRLLENAAPLHDMGKIGIPDSVLLKPGRLDETEVQIMRRHTEYGCDIVSTMNRDEWRDYAAHTSLGADFMVKTCSPILRVASVIALTHHERWDGTGYPRGLRGENIPLEGRITAVADVFDALSTKRPYKPALQVDECLRIMEENRGTHFDPRVLDAFFASKAEILKIRVEFADDNDEVVR